MNEVQKFTMQPTNLAEAMKFSEMLANSSFCPKDMKGKAGDVLVCVQMGMELGLSPTQALQSIAVINGRPSLYGDGLLAVAMGSPNYQSHREWKEGSIKDRTLTAYCGVTRKGSTEHVYSFSISDATQANLWGKSGPWSQYPDRMLAMRARGFAIRDQFADALRGINIAEEAHDLPDIQVKADVVNDMLELNPKEQDKTCTAMEFIAIMDKAEDAELLKEAFIEATKKFKNDKELLETLIEAKDRNKARLEMTEEIGASKADEINDILNKE